MSSYGKDLKSGGILTTARVQNVGNWKKIIGTNAPAETIALGANNSCQVVFTGAAGLSTPGVSQIYSFTVDQPAYKNIAIKSVNYSSAGTSNAGTVWSVTRTAGGFAMERKNVETTDLNSDAEVFFTIEHYRSVE